MNWGDHLVRAYAATISLHLAGKVPYLAATRTPLGEVSYAVRGKADKNKLIGVQHYDHPEFRLLALWDTAQKRGLHIYSTEACAVCSPDGPEPPAGVRGRGHLPAPLRSGRPGRLPPRQGRSGHQGPLEGSQDHPDRYVPACAKDDNTVHVLASRIAAKDPTDDFEVEVISDLKCTACCPDCRVKERLRFCPRTSSDGT